MSSRYANNELQPVPSNIEFKTHKDLFRKQFTLYISDNFYSMSLDSLVGNNNLFNSSPNKYNQTISEYLTAENASIEVLPISVLPTTLFYAPLANEEIDPSSHKVIYGSKFNQFINENFNTILEEHPSFIRTLNRHILPSLDFAEEKMEDPQYWGSGRKTIIAFFFFFKSALLNKDSLAFVMPDISLHPTLLSHYISYIIKYTEYYNRNTDPPSDANKYYYSLLENPDVYHSVTHPLLKKINPFKDVTLDL